MATPIHFDFNQSPSDLIAYMDESKNRATIHNDQHRRYRRVPFILFVGGLAMFGLDFLIGYNFFTCSLLGVVLIVSAAVMRYSLRRRSHPPNFGPQYDLTRVIFDTLQDDIAPKRTIMGQLDLSGSQQESKQYRKKRSAAGRPIAYYRDEWFRMKGKLYDGNVLRLSLINKQKVREGFYKRSAISGKRKWKVGSSQTIYQANISISANPDLYSVAMVDLNGQLIPETRFTVLESTIGQGRIILKLASDRSIGAWDVLNALQYAYQLLERNGSASAPGLAG